MTIGISIVIILALVLLCGYFSMAKTALIHAKRALLQKEGEEGDRRATAASALVNDTDAFIETIQVVITLTGFFVAVVATMNLSAPLSVWLEGFGIDWLTLAAPVLAPVGITLIVSYVSIVLGELFPRRVALAHAEKITETIAPSLVVTKKIMTPFVWLTSISAKGLARLFRVKDKEERQSASEEEIKYLVTDAQELHEDEKRMIHEIIDLGDMTVREVMTPRVDMMFVEKSETVRQALERMRGTGYSRLPVYQEEYDCIVGIAHYKDLVTPLLEGKEEETVEGYTFEAFFVPETKEIYPLLSEMQTNRQQMAIVVDEYGGTDGLITVEDILEEIVGEIIDETDPDNKYLTMLSDNEWRVDGRYPCDDAAELGWPVEESDDYETIAGWLMDVFDSVPQVGDEFEIKGYQFKVQSMRRRRISAIRVKKLPVSETGDASAENIQENISREEK